MSYEDLVHFFEMDSRIKIEMQTQWYPNDEDMANELDREKYKDTLSKNLQEFYHKGLVFLNQLGTDESVLKILQSRFKESFEVLFHAGDASEIKQFYRNYITDLRPIILEKVGSSFSGNTSYNYINPVIKEAKTVNECLHIMHSYIVNNETIHQKMPLQAKIEGNLEIDYYGYSSTIGDMIYHELIELKLDSPYIDIFSIPEDNRVLLMIQGYGHATTFDIKEYKKGTSYMVHYFIPKISNPEMVNRLKGVNKVSDNSDLHDFTTGIFYAQSIEDLKKNLFDVIKHLPTDFDMEINR